MFTIQEYPYGTAGGPDPEDMPPELEEPRCSKCGHEITTVPIIRILSEADPDAQWDICQSCLQGK